jgi:tryptophan-rich sensory protein
LAVLGLSLAACAATATVGGFFRPGDWYAALNKPSWNPPNGVFAPVWTTLYLMMAVAAWRAWRAAGWRRARGGLLAFLIQLILNAHWSWLFFGLQRPDLALVDLALLWVALLATLLLFWRADRFAGLLLVPYLMWVSFAGALNMAIWRLNS